MRNTRCALLLSTCALLTGCWLPPPEEDVAIGAALADSIESEIGRYAAADLEAYVERLGQRLVGKLEETPFRYRFAVLDQPEPNAFAAPGGFVYVSRGLILLANSEDELAGVIGHEISHVEQRHTARRLARSRLPGFLSLPGRVLGRLLSEDVGRLVNAPVNTIGGLTLASYGRSQESESDRLGQDLAARCGYEPLALAAILDRMERFVETLTSAKRRPTFFDSHPPTPTRSSEIRSRAANVAVAARDGAALDADEFVRGLDGLVYGVNPAQGERRGRLFVHPVLDIAVAFPDGWAAVNTRAMVGAVAPERDAFVFYAATGDARADDLADSVAARKAKFAASGLRPARDERIEKDGRVAHVLEFSEGAGADAAHVFHVFMVVDGRLHEFLGAAPEARRETIRTCLRSLRPLTGRERGSFAVDVVRVVEARAEETVTDILARSNSLVTAGVTATINGVDALQPLAAGRLVKIVAREPFRP